MIQIDNKFDFGQTVFLKTDKDQLPRMVVHLMLKPGNVLLYGMCHGTIYYEHYEIEISIEKDVLTTLT